MSRLRVGSAEYDEHKRAEIDHYAAVFKAGQEEPAPHKHGGEHLFQPVPKSWIEVETRAAQLIEQKTGHNLLGHLIARMQSRPMRMLSLGSGPGGVELLVAQNARDSRIVCTDFNPHLLDLGRNRAAELGVNTVFELADLNAVTLPHSSYDVVLCHASLHHVIELERLAGEIQKTLLPGGELIVVDVIARSGYLMWPESKAIAANIFRTFPEELRLNHTAYTAPRMDEDLWEADTSTSGMECIRSGDIVDVLSASFRTRAFVPYFSLCRRFFDTMYGPNFRLDDPLHAAILNWTWELDRHYIERGILRPETFFGIFAPR